jgi:F-box and leucine-rich repeat protein 2/20
MKRKRNSLKSSQQQQQQSLSSIITRSKTLHAAATKFYLPDECWESIFKFIINNRHDFKSLSLVSRQFLSITNRLPFSLTIRKQTRPFLPRLFHRFTNLSSINFTCYYYYGDLNKLLREISHFLLKLTSLNLSNKYTFPANGL